MLSFATDGTVLSKTKASCLKERSHEPRTRVGFRLNMDWIRMWKMLCCQLWTMLCSQLWTMLCCLLWTMLCCTPWTRLFSHYNKVVQSSILLQLVKTKLSSNDNNSEKARSINIPFSCSNNRRCFVNAEQHCWNNSENHRSFNNIVQPW